MFLLLLLLSFSLLLWHDFRCVATPLAQPNFQLCATKINKNIPFLAFYFSFFLFGMQSHCLWACFDNKIGYFLLRFCWPRIKFFVFLSVEDLCWATALPLFRNVRFVDAIFFFRNSLFFLATSILNFDFSVSQSHDCDATFSKIVAGLSRNLLFSRWQEKSIFRWPMDFRFRIIIFLAGLAFFDWCCRRKYRMKHVRRPVLSNLHNVLKQLVRFTEVVCAPDIFVRLVRWFLCNLCANTGTIRCCVAAAAAHFSHVHMFSTQHTATVRCRCV